MIPYLLVQHKPGQVGKQVQVIMNMMPIDVKKEFIFIYNLSASANEEDDEIFKETMKQLIYLAFKDVLPTDCTCWAISGQVFALSTQRLAVTCTF